VQRSSWLFVFVAVAGLGVLAARAQNLDEGKTAPQLFAADCVACHKGPQGLGKNASVGFLRQHYTSSTRSAELLSAYLASAGAGSPRADRQKAGRGEEREAREPKEPKESKEARAKRKARDKTAAKSSDPAAHPERKGGRKTRRPVTPASEPAANTAPPPATTVTAPKSPPDEEAKNSNSPPSPAPSQSETAAGSPAPSTTPPPESAPAAAPPPGGGAVATAATTPPPAPRPQPVFETPLP